MELFSTPQTGPFVVALLVMLGIALLEGVATLLGAGLSSVIDALLPEPGDLSVELNHDPEIGIDAGDAQGAGVFSRFLSWLRVGQVPVLMLLVIFLTAFGILGLILQSQTHRWLGFYWPALMASIPAVLLALPVVRGLGGLLVRFMPQDETEAVSVDTLVGRVAVLTIGTAQPGRAAEARVKDAFGTSHYVMVEPDGDEQFAAGDEVLLVSRENAIFKGIRNTNRALSER